MHSVMSDDMLCALLSHSQKQRGWVAHFITHTPCCGPGARAQQLCRAVSEAACSLLLASWRSGDLAGVKAAFLPLSDIEGFSALASTATERQVPASLLL